MCPKQNAASRCLITAPRLHTDVAILHNIGSANAIGAAALVEFREHLCWREPMTIDGHHVATLEGQRQFLGLIRRRFRTDRPAPHLLLGRHPWVLQHIPLVGDVQQIGIHRIRGLFLGFGEINRNVVLLAITHQCFPGVKIPLTPGCDNLNARFQRVSAQLKSHLVITLTCCTVGNGISTCLGRNFYQSLCN